MAPPKVIGPPRLKEITLPSTRTKAAPKKSHPTAKPGAPLKTHHHHPIQPSTPTRKHKASTQSKPTNRSKKVTFSPLRSPPTQRQRQRQKQQPTSSHPLYLEFAEATSTYRRTLTTRTLTSLSTAHATLQNHLTSIHAQHASTLANHDAEIQQKGLLLPLADDRLEVTTTINGMRTKTQHVLGEEMSAFAATVAAEEANLRELWKQWGEVQRGIISLAAGVFGNVGGAGHAGEGDGVMEGEAGISGGYKREMQELKEEWRRKVERVVEEVGYQGETMIEQLESDEAADKSRRAQQQKTFMMFMMQDM